MFLGLIACRRIFGTSVSVLLVRGGGVLVNIVGLVLSGTDANRRRLCRRGLAGGGGGSRGLLLLLETHLDEPVRFDLIVQHDIEEEDKHSLKNCLFNFDNSKRQTRIAAPILGHRRQLISRSMPLPRIANQSESLKD